MLTRSFVRSLLLSPRSVTVAPDRPLASLQRDRLNRPRDKLAAAAATRDQESRNLSQRRLRVSLTQPIVGSALESLYSLCSVQIRTLLLLHGFSLLKLSTSLSFNLQLCAIWYTAGRTNSPIDYLVPCLELGSSNHTPCRHEVPIHPGKPKKKKNNNKLHSSSIGICFLRLFPFRFVAIFVTVSKLCRTADHIVLRCSSRELHVVVLGAGGVGKSCLTAQFVHNEWIESYDPTIEDSYRTQVQVDGRQVILEILDTAGTEQFVAMRDLYMKTGQGFLLVFSITSASSLNELEGLREEILRIKDDDNVPMVIVGNKADLEEARAIPRAKGFAISQKWGAPYYEASARTRTNVDEVFIDLCRQMLRKEDDTTDPDDASRIDALKATSNKRRRRSKFRDSTHPRCVIL